MGVGVKFLASENWCGRVHFGGHSPEWRVLSKFSVQPCCCGNFGIHGRFDTKKTISNIDVWQKAAAPC